MKRSDKEQAFLKVIDQYKPLISKIARSYTKDQQTYQDLVQEIILQLWRSFDSYNDQFKLSTWIYRIALNVSISGLRKETKGPTYQSIERIDLPDEGSEEMNDEVKVLYKIIDQFDSLNKALMILYLEDKSYAEISSILGITETNVATKLNRLKKKLKVEFSKI